MSDTAALLNLTKCLLDAIVEGQWETYVDLCDESLTCFEPEAKGNLVEGLDFHRYYFQLERPTGQRIQTTIASPHVRVMGDIGIVSYLRLTQSLEPNGSAHTSSCEETRVWQRNGSSWKLVHFHRSAVN